MSVKKILVPLIVLIVVFVIWFNQNLFREHRSEVPVEIRILDLPEDMVVTEIYPEEIELIVEGRGIDIYRFNKSLYYLSISYNELSLGNNELTLTEQYLYLDEPQNNTGLRFHLNRRVTVVIDHSIIRQVSVELRYMTEDDEFYFQQRNVGVQPQEVEIVGPNNLVSEITSITTVPLSRDMIEQSAGLTVDLEIPEGILGIKPDVVSITLESLSIITRTIPLINIDYPQEKLSMIIPQAVTVKIEGPADRIQRIRPQMISAYISIPEDYEYDFANIQFRLPDDIKLVEFTPERVQIFHHE